MRQITWPWCGKLHQFQKEPRRDSLRVTGMLLNIINLEVQEEPRVSCFELTPCPGYERRIDANLTRQPSCKEAERTLFINQG